MHDMASWLRVKPMYAFDAARFTPGWAEAARQARASGALTVVRMPGGFNEPRELMGEEELCVAYYEQPELIHDMLATMGAMCEQVLDIVSREVTVDVLTVPVDMAGKSGPLAGPMQIRDFIAPYYHRCWDLLASRGAQLFQQDSDGNMDARHPGISRRGHQLHVPHGAGGRHGYRAGAPAIRQPPGGDGRHR